jgi:hypothetical protein
MLREATCLGLLPARQASIACMLPERFLFDSCVNPPWTISVAPVDHHRRRRAGSRTGGARGVSEFDEGDGREEGRGRAGVLLLEALLEAVDAELCNGGKPPHECFLSIRSDQKGMVPEIHTTPYRSLLSEQQQPAADGEGGERRLGEGLAQPPTSMAAPPCTLP